MQWQLNGKELIMLEVFQLKTKEDWQKVVREESKMILEFLV